MKIFLNFVLIYKFLINGSSVVVLGVNVLAIINFMGKIPRKYKKSQKLTKFTLKYSSIESAVAFRMTAVPIPRQVIDGDAVLANSRCTCIFQSSCEWYFINFVGKFGIYSGTLFELPL